MHLTDPRHPRFATLRALALAMCAGAIVAACGPAGLDGAGDTINSGTGSGNGSIGASSSGSSTSTYTVGGNIIGLSGSGLVLANGGEQLAISGNGGFIFSNRVAGGAAYAVTIRSQPINPSQICTVANGAGTVSTVNVNSVTVSCTTNFYTVSATVSNLTGSGLVLQTNAGNNVAVASSGSYTLATLASGSNYTVTVLTQPTSPSQTCTIANDAGMIGGANVTNVAVSCASNNYTVGGNVTGLTGSGLVVQTNGANNVSVSAAGSYVFATLPSGTAYTVTVLSQPSNPSQTCAVANGGGTITSANYTLVAISCTRSGHAAGRYAFVSDYGADTVSAFAIDAITGNLALVNSAPSDIQPYAIAVTPNGAFVYTANVGAADISIYAVNATTGALTSAGTASTGVGSAPDAIAVDPSGLFVLAADSAGATLVVLQINQTTGALTQVPGSPFATDVNPAGNASGVTVDPSGRYVFATNQFDPPVGLAGYTFNSTPGSGDLTQFPTWQVPTGNGALWVTVDALDRFIYASNSLDGTVSGWTIGVGGALSAITGSPFGAGFTAGAQTGVIAIDPSGRFLYVTDTANNQLDAFTVDQTTGALTPMAGSPFGIGNGAFGVAIDPSAQFLYVANSFDASISMFTLSPTTGVLTAVPGSPRTYGGANASAIVVE
jgi:6-phosphogluconolactonase (cycloisomerase 2 family)